MSEYLTPGVYIEEIEIGAKPIEGVSTSTAAFLGKTERGPIDPRLVTSFDQFKRLYGGYLSDSYLAYAVDGFFRNGGSRCYIARITEIDGTAKASSITFEKPAGSKILKVDALGPGLWGNSIYIKIENAGLHNPDPDLFRLSLTYNGIEEVYDNLSIHPSASDYYEKRVNGISNLIVLSHQGGEVRPDNTSEATGKKLEGGSDGTGELTATDYVGKEIDTATGLRVGLVALERISEISIICIPDEARLAGLTDSLITHCENMRDRFAVLQSASTTSDVSSLLPPKDTKYAAFYHPWIQIIDPVSNLPKYVPPGGHISGIYARSDVERGVHKAPANETVSGALGLKFDINKAEQDILNPRGVNCLRAFPGQGIKVWGARTASRDPLWKYVNVRRLFIFLEKSLGQGISWAVFEPSNEALWARVRQTISQFLTTVWRSGALMGTTEDEAFFVKCDRNTMTQSDIDNGRLIVMVGVAPVKPAEFVIFRIAQVANASSLSE